MSDYVTYETIIDALRQAVEPLPYVQAMWEGGAAAFERMDTWSDIDLYVVADDDQVSEALAVIETTLEDVAGIDLRYELPPPTWHGHVQLFYRLQRASPYLMVDLLVMALSAPEKFMESDIHGQLVVHFDKVGVVEQAPQDTEERQEAIKAWLQQMQVWFEIARILPRKELNRGNNLEALTYYRNHTLRPLMQILRIKHSPAHYRFHTRYVYYELPPAVVARLEPLFFVHDAQDLAIKQDEAEMWFRQLMQELMPG